MNSKTAEEYKIFIYLSSWATLIYSIQPGRRSRPKRLETGYNEYNFKTMLSQETPVIQHGGPKQLSARKRAGWETKIFGNGRISGWLFGGLVSGVA